MKYIYKIFFTTLLVIAPIYSAWATNSVPLDKVVAVVNDQVITQSELNKAINIVKEQFQAANSPLPSLADMHKQVLNELILKDIQLQTAKRAGIKVTEAQLDDAIDKIAAQNKLNLASLKQKLTAQHMTYSQFRQQIREQMLISELQKRAIAGNINVSEQDIQAVLKNAPKQMTANAVYHIQDILIPLTSSATSAQTQAAKQNANKIIQQLRKDVAVQKAISATGAQVNDLGWRSASQLPDLFSKQVQGLSTGDVAGPIYAPNGLHILKLAAVQGNAPKLTPITARELAFQRKFQEQLQMWLNQLRASAYVKIM